MAAQKTSERKRGRPTIQPERRKRNNVTIRLRDDLKLALQEAGAVHGRSLSEEIEFRLEQSFLDEDARFADFGGKGGYELFHLIGTALRVIGEQAGKEQWWRDPETYDTITEVLPGLLKAFRPKGHWARVAGSTLTGLTMDIEMEITKPTKSGPQVERSKIQLGGSHLDKIEL